MYPAAQVEEAPELIFGELRSIANRVALYIANAHVEEGATQVVPINDVPLPIRREHSSDETRARTLPKDFWTPTSSTSSAWRP
jgi:hypothetical protein